MIGMQYKVNLPKDYDMGIIRKRVQDNGHKTDGFPGLHFKAYLITTADADGSLYNSYAPLYVWNESQGMNKFIFEGYYDNILASFGWQHIQIGVPLSMNLADDFHTSKFVVEYAGNISEVKSLRNPSFETIGHYVKNEEKSLGDLFVYNPDKWGYSYFRFFQEKPIIDSFNHMKVYEILHVSR